jgi:hypothetical protein
MKIKTVPNPSGELQYTPRGMDIFPGIKYPVIFICSVRGAGKTTLIYNIVQRIARKFTDPEGCTKIYHVSGTIDKDPGNISMVRKFERAYKYQTYQAMDELDYAEIKNTISDSLEQGQGVQKPPEAPPHISLFGAPPSSKRKPKPPPKVSDQLIICDDVSGELRDPKFAVLVKNSRHYRARIILSSQYVTDVLPGIRSQIDFLFLFRGIPLDKLKVMHLMAKIEVTFEEFTELYRELKGHHFLMVDIRNGDILYDHEIPD